MVLSTTQWTLAYHAEQSKAGVPVRKMLDWTYMLRDQQKARNPFADLQNRTAGGQVPQKKRPDGVVALVPAKCRRSHYPRCLLAQPKWAGGRTHIEPLLLWPSFQILQILFELVPTILCNIRSSHCSASKSLNQKCTLPCTGKYKVQRRDTGYTKQQIFAKDTRRD